MLASFSNRPPLLGEKVRENERKSHSVGQSESVCVASLSLSFPLLSRFARRLYASAPCTLPRRNDPGIYRKSVYHTHVVMQRSLLARAILVFPVHGPPFDPASSSFPFSQCLSPFRLALTLFAILLVVCAVRWLLTWRMRIGAKKAVAVVVEKQSAVLSNDSEQKRSSWLDVTLSRKRCPPSTPSQSPSPSHSAAHPRRPCAAGTSTAADRASGSTSLLTSADRRRRWA
ncbi:hypothetical protein C8R45DRAFT_422182 [Mycena sanguinolenta]|nr:hypothetical protein C8R45DRAFT_422182 [Mycena sanguinolenta]